MGSSPIPGSVPGMQRTEVADTSGHDSAPGAARQSAGARSHAASEVLRRQGPSPARLAGATSDPSPASCDPAARDAAYWLPSPQSERSQSLSKRPFMAPLAILAIAVVGGALGGCDTGQPTLRTELGYELGVGAATGAGRVLVDRAGHTLYALVLDHRGPSRCFSFCAVQWPPVVVARRAEELRLGPGVRHSLVGELRRPGGGFQLTYDGWPLYAYRLDDAPGQATGQGDAMGLWYVMSPDGHMNR
jgi:predicted lipoprotein with Yx(FWY)xxD motif